jgi:hypothetical protein
LRLWLESLVILIAVGCIARGGPGWPARWGSRPLPPGARRPWLLAVTLVGLFALATAARLGALRTVPYGINPDEGDQALVSLAIARGHSHPGVFEDGWYQLPMLYFFLLAWFMKVVGLRYVQARAFGALFGILTVIAVTWLGIRNWKARRLAGGRTARADGRVPAICARHECGQPDGGAVCDQRGSVSGGARRGKDWAWIGAGLAGGFSVYFYPTGRLWALLATGFCLYSS